MKNKDIYLLYILVVVTALTIVGLLLVPTYFYDNFIWKYFYGPVIEDAQNAPAIYHNVRAAEKFTLVSELVYGIAVFLLMYYIYRLLKKLKIPINTAFGFALLPYFAYGAVARVLEDAQYFSLAFSSWFVTPFIYLQIIFFGIIFGVTGWYFTSHFERQQEKKYGLYYPIIVVLFFDFVITSLYFSSASYHMNAGEIILLFIVSFIFSVSLIRFYYTRKKISVNVFLVSGGLLLLLPSVYLVIRWILGFQWSDSTGIRFDVADIVLGIVISIVGLAYFIGLRSHKNMVLTTLKDPLNLSMIFGQLLDGFTSYISILNPLGFPALHYTEKHFFSDSILGIWGPLYPIIKFSFILIIIYLFDVFYKKDLRKYSELVIIFKISILLLGFSPGLRDILRVTMGV